MQDRIVAWRQRANSRTILDVKPGSAAFGAEVPQVLAGLPPDLKGPELMRLFGDFKSQDWSPNHMSWSRSPEHEATPCG